MKHTGLKIILLLLPLLVFSNRPEGKFKKLKTIERSFDASGIGTMFIDNTYGNINVIAGNETQVSITVNIKVDGDDEDAVEERFNRINILFEQNSSEISAKTIFGKTSSNGGSWWSWFFGGSNQNTNFKINYTVKMPQQWHLKINNDYGNIYLNKLSGDFDLNADYGSFEIGQLLGNHNTFSTDYFSRSSIDFVKNATIDADYSRINIGSAYRLILNCDYSTIRIDDVRQLKFNNDYGAIYVKNVKQVDGTGDYQTRSFGNVDSVKFSGDYGSLKIDGLLPGFEILDLSCDYTTIKIYNHHDIAFRFEMKQSYGCFKSGDMSVYKETNNNGDKTINAYYKDRSASSLIKINMDYGCVKIE